jgi:two-component system sensor histidine kinase UhpB
VVQEALTNSVRHADAQTIDISVRTHAGHLQVEVRADGIGLDPARRRSGLGLRGLEERVKELDGAMTITRQPRGTTLAVRLPVPSAPSKEGPFARAAG